MRCAYVGLLLALSGCNPTRGLADTADAALPAVKRYFDPGSQLVDGPWNRVVIDLDVDTLYHVGARRLDDKQPTFHLFGADAREGCQVTPNAGTWMTGKPDAAPFRLLPYLEDIDERGRGRLRFTTLDCQVQELALEDAGRPYPRLYDHGYLVPTKQGYTFADPWSGETREIAARLQDVLVWNTTVLLWADDELKSYSEQFERGSEWGNKIAAVIPIGDDFLVEDADGIHHVKLDRDSLSLTSEDVLPDACHLQTSEVVAIDEKGAFIAAEVPCGSVQPTLLHLDAKSFETLDSFPLPFDADARQTRALLAGSTADAPLPLAAVYLTDVDADGLGSLWAWRAGTEAPIKLGEHATLDQVFLLPGEGTWNGVARVNYQMLGGYQATDWVNFHWDGTIKLVAERIVRNASSGEMLVNFDGVSGDVPEFLGDTYRVIAQGVPAYTEELASYVGEHHQARVDHFDGAAGRAVLGAEGQDPAAWDVVGNDVPPELMRFSWFMPALVFVENWDQAKKTGSLVAYNYELDARTTIADGVSSFDLTSYPWDGVVYSVPRGTKRGIWFSKAK
ncbi:MAG TPA: hypothetical protein VNG33_14875 [Polyangiaceae bacterium]|nr:hypothetical protein [Polyangiaceae bacterium]